jgi:hypothetical protein
LLQLQHCKSGWLLAHQGAARRASTRTLPYMDISSDASFYVTIPPTMPNKYSITDCPIARVRVGFEFVCIRFENDRLPALRFVNLPVSTCLSGVLRPSAEHFSTFPPSHSVFILMPLSKTILE